eukprot:CAMPEP_0201590880 /NCGR_PEP_ID=MMETSP0190_2-20130828/182878_1 /ASSEMBLY_ACC=CAM_ASM_000263 /TAXON_ID=37353 /ORGANISM="Rosalina sp." /LENGTH=160 /DNA_ID=CAMNT_0048047939 /DNA_START=113 /DNA_END=592 /DNA_ORIENTATION=+
MNEAPDMYPSGIMGICYEVPKQSATDAQKFFNENLDHLKGEYRTSDWIVEQFFRIITACGRKADSEEDYLAMIDGMEAECHEEVQLRANEARERIRAAESEEEKQQEVDSLRSDTNCFKALWQGISSIFELFKKGLKKMKEKVKEAAKQMVANIQSFFSW